MKGQGILIVEDENIVALDMRMRLEAMGYTVLDVVDTAPLALEKAAELSPELVLMDIKLKGEMDGIEAAVQLRKTSEIPVIFVTAFTDERTLDRAKRASPYGYIVKPFHERELRIAIELAIYKYQYELSIRRAKDIAEESNRVKGEFLANMSHELKTPLNSVIGFSELALGVSQDREQREYLSIVLSSAKSLLTLIDSILDFARMEAGKLTAISAPFSLDELLDECTDSLAIAACPKGLHATMRRDPAIPDTLVGDRSLLKHILLNLLDNAVKFTDSGKVRLEAALSELPDTPGRGPVVRFTVSDTGIGMAKDKVELAFARFSQLDASKTRKAGGTGLGLAIVAKSVELMKGDISVDSEPNRGALFNIRIPFDECSESAPEGPDSRGGGGSVAVLGFDDEEYADVALVLGRLGYRSENIATVEMAEAVEGEYAIVAESVLTGSEGAIADFPGKKLIVATQLGGELRSKLSGSGVAFASQPLRYSGLRKSFLQFAAPAKRASPREPRAPASSAPREDGRAIARLADDLEKEIADGSLSAAERLAKEAQGLLLDQGDAEGARVAFSALLATRRGDRGAARDSIAKIRRLANVRDKEGAGGSAEEAVL